VAVANEVQWPAPPAVGRGYMAVFQHMEEFAVRAMPVAEQLLADEVFLQGPVGPPGREVTCSRRHEMAGPGTYVLDALEEDSGKEPYGLGTVAVDNSLVLEIGGAVRTASADGRPLEWPPPVGNDVGASKATAVGNMAAAVVSCLELDRGACLATLEEVQPVVVGSYQEAEAALALEKKMPCSQH